MLISMAVNPTCSSEFVQVSSQLIGLCYHKFNFDAILSQNISMEKGQAFGFLIFLVS